MLVPFDGMEMRRSLDWASCDVTACLETERRVSGTCTAPWLRLIVVKYAYRWHMDRRSDPWASCRLGIGNGIEFTLRTRMLDSFLSLDSHTHSALVDVPKRVHTTSVRFFSYYIGNKKRWMFCRRFLVGYCVSR